jgi:hypothetical protein
MVAVTGPSDTSSYAGVRPEVADQVAGRGRGGAVPPEDEQVVGVVGSHLAEPHGHHRLAGEPDNAVVEQLPLVGTGQGTRAGIDREVAGRFAVAPVRVGRLRVDEVDGPGNLGVVVGDLVEGAVVVVREDAEAGSLPLDPALGVFKPALRFRQLTHALRPDEELVGAVADPSDPDRWMDAVRRCHSSLPRPGRSVGPSRTASPTPCRRALRGSWFSSASGGEPLHLCTGGWRPHRALEAGSPYLAVIAPATMRLTDVKGACLRAGLEEPSACR